MSWATAKRAAEHFFRQMPHLPEDFSGATVRLSQFPDQATKDFLKPDDLAWSVEFHTMVNRALAREFRRRNARVEFITIELPEFFDWLVASKKENSPATRAEFISLKTK